MRQDKHAEILALDAAERSRLGAAVDVQIRSVQRIRDFEMMPDTEAGALFREETWSSTGLVRNGMLALCDVHSFSLSEDGEGFDGLRSVVEHLTEKAVRSMKTLQDTLLQKKKEVANVHRDTAEVMRLMGTVSDACDAQDFPPALVAIVKKYDSDAATSTMQQCLACAPPSRSNHPSQGYV